MEGFHSTDEKQENGKERLHWAMTRRKRSLGSWGWEGLAGYAVHPFRQQRHTITRLYAVY